MTRAWTLLLIALMVTACGSSHSGTVAANALIAPTAGGIGGGGGGAAAAAASQAAGATSSTTCPLTAAQVSGVMGATYAAPTVASGICSYVGATNTLGIHVTEGSGATDWATALATLKRDQASQSTTVIAGLGDRAAGDGLEIIVASGSHIIDVRNADSPGFGSWPRSTALAQLAIAALS